ncbi:hypothetical protein [Bradyrhizobium elkanii]|uniref:hypothetical protein n=1 Tax=Bradyrhizobium elkanii TaxID=29448 RepID=UPI003D1C34BF
MDPEKLTPEELAAEQAQVQLPKEEEVRAEIIQEFGFDPENDKERIEKAVAKEMSSRTKLSKAIGQKIAYRTKLNEPKPPAATPPKAPDTSPQQPSVSDAVNEALEKRDLDDMDYPDNIKQEIARVAKITGKSVKAAARDPYVVATFIEPHNKKVAADKAGLSRNGNNTGGSGAAFTIDNPPVIDSSTPEKLKETTKAFEDWKAAMKEQGH